ncbi:hypothetical protein ACTXT7_006278 [Hymenolepis weldensis]
MKQKVYYEQGLTYDCGVHKANKTDQIMCARTDWEMRYVTGRVENKCRRTCRDLLSQSVIKIPAAQRGFVFKD